MSELLQDLAAFMEALPPLWAYVALFLIAFGENVVPPIPGDMAVVFAGYLVGIGRLNFAVVILLSTLGGVLGFMAMYAVGYRVGDAVKSPHRYRWISPARIERAQDWLEQWGFGLVAANRFLSGLRSVISLTVGMARVHLFYTMLYATLSAFVWTMLIAYAGYAVGENWQQIGGYLRTYGRAVFVVLVLLVGLQAARWYLKRRGRRNDGSDSGNFTGGRG